MKAENHVQEKKPLISVIMPVYNAGHFLVEAIESILNQTYSNWELICVDDGSKDDSFKILKSFADLDKRIKVLKNKINMGIGFSLNKALRWVRQAHHHGPAQGDFIARMDADDVSLVERLEKQLQFLLKNPQIIACGGQVEIIDAKGRFLGKKYFYQDPKKCYQTIFKIVPLQHAALMVKSEVMEKYCYQENLTTAEDVDLMFYLLKNGQISNVADFVYQYRKADSSNGYHRVKKTFNLTLLTRFKAIFKYGYRPTVGGLFSCLAQFVVVSILPAKLIVKIFEALRFRDVSGQRLVLTRAKIAPELSR